MLTITLAHISYTASFVAIAVLGRLAGIDRTLEEAAQDLGATPRLVFLLAGVSYYKTAAPPVVDLGDLATTAAERAYQCHRDIVCRKRDTGHHRHHPGAALANRPVEPIGG